MFQKYDDLAAKDKKRYEKEMKDYKPEAAEEEEEEEQEASADEE